MSDKTACANEECLKRKECGEYHITPSEYQSYYDFGHICNIDSNYSMYVERGED